MFITHFIVHHIVVVSDLTRSAAFRWNDFLTGVSWSLISIPLEWCVVDLLESRIGDLLRLFSIGESEGQRSQNRDDCRKVFICLCSLIDDNPTERVPGITAVFDAGFSKIWTSHPLIPLSLTYNLTSISDQTTLLHRFNQLLFTSNEYRHHIPAYYACMTEHHFLKSLPTISPPPSLTAPFDLTSLLLLALNSNSSKDSNQRYHFRAPIHWPTDDTDENLSVSLQWLQIWICGWRWNFCLCVCIVLLCCWSIWWLFSTD